MTFLLGMNRFVWFLLAVFMLSFVGATSPPTISNQPQSATVPVGQAVVFAVTAEGEGLSYQWLKNGQDIGGETQPALSIQAVQLSDDGSAFQARVTNDKGVVLSCTAKLTVIEGGTASTGPPECPTVNNSGDEGGGGCGGGGGGGGGSSSGGSSSGGSSGDPSIPDLTPYPVTRWKGSVKATTIINDPATQTSTTMTTEGEVTFESSEHDIGVHPRSLGTVEGSFTVKRTGTVASGCTVDTNATGTIMLADGEIELEGDPPPPERATQLKYEGRGSSSSEGTTVYNCPSTGMRTEAWVEREIWLDTGPERLTTSVDLLVIEGTYTHDYGGGMTTKWEWNLVKQR